MVILIVSVAAATDLWRGKIANWLTIPALATGLLVSAFAGGWVGLADSSLGILLGLAAYGWMYAIGVMGAGDVKLLMALGAWGGPRFAAETGVAGVVCGGVLALALLAFQGKLGEFLSKIRDFVYSVASRELETRFPAVDRKLTMPFGVAIAAGAIWTVFGEPLRALGWNG